MKAEREDFVRFVSDVRLILEGPEGSLADTDGMVQKETLDRLSHKLARKYADWEDSPQPELEDPRRRGHRPRGHRPGPARANSGVSSS